MVQVIHQIGASDEKQGKMGGARAELRSASLKLGEHNQAEREATEPNCMEGHAQANKQRHIMQ